MVTWTRNAFLLCITVVFLFQAVAEASLEDPAVPPSIRGKEIVYIEAENIRVPVVDGEFVITVEDEEALNRALARAPFDQYEGKLEIVSLQPEDDRVAEILGSLSFRLDFPIGLDMKALQAEIAQNPDVMTSDPNVLTFETYTPNDTDFNKQWPLYNDGSLGGTADADIWAREAWDYEDGDSGVNVWVIDTGIPMTTPSPGSLSHPDLDDSSRIDPIDNMLTPGTVDDPRDDNAHGTHVAGIVAAEWDNSTGIAGVCPNCSIKVIKALSVIGSCTLSEQTNALIVALFESALSGARTIINMSWKLAEGYDLVGESGFEARIAWPSTYNKTNVLFVAAAGNYKNCPTTRNVFYPAAYAATYNEMIAVAATDDDDEPACWSAYGSQVTIAAPGEDVYSTTPDYEVGGCCSNPALNYDKMSGTSMAAPHVSGVAGLLWSSLPAATASQIKGYLTSGAAKVGSYAYGTSNRNDYMGYGRLDACGSQVAAGLRPAYTCLRIITPLQAQKIKKKVTVAANVLPYLLPLVGFRVLKARARKKKNNQN